jgi:uncharacterized protein involved in exopolysaccharide biosynthesis
MSSHAHISDDPANETSLVALWQVLWDRKIIIVACTLAFAVIAAILAMLAKPSFRAEVVVVQVSDDKMGGAGALLNQVGGLASLMGMNLGMGNQGRDADAVLMSQNLISEFIKRHVPLTELFPAGGKTPPTLWLGVKQFKETVLTIREDARKGTKTIVIDWRDPAVAARWANDFVALANEMLRNRAIAESTRNIAYLKEQIRQTDVVELQRVMYGLIEAEMKQLTLANGRIEYAFTTVDPAVAPEIRHSPRRTVMVIIGGLIGGMLGVLIALFSSAWRRHSAAKA